MHVANRWQGKQIIIGFCSGVQNSLLWFTVVPISLQVIPFVSTTILARILSPDDFGIVGLPAIFPYFSNTFTEFGFS